MERSPAPSRSTVRAIEVARRLALGIILSLGPLVAACSRGDEAPQEIPLPHVRAAQVAMRAPYGRSRHLALLQPIRRARIAPRYGGLVVELGVDEEQEVAEGDLLVRLAAGDAFGQLQSAEGSLAQARERVRDTKQELVRSEELVEKGAEAARQAEARRSSVVELEGARQQARGQLVQARDRLRASRIVAPFAGTITRIDTEVGEYADVRSPVLVLADLTRLSIDIKLSAREAALHDQGKLDFVAIVRGEEVPVTLDYLATEADEGTSTFTARLVLDNLDEAGQRRFRAGETVELHVTGERGEPRPAVPATAIRWAGPSSYVLRLDRDGGDTVSQVPVRVLDDAGDLVTIDSELGPGAWVVASGPLSLRSGDRVAIAEVYGQGAAGVGVDATGREGQAIDAPAAPGGG